MHEYSITCSILEILNKIVKENKIKKIKRVNFEISLISSIEPRSVEFYYEFLTKDNNTLKNARLDFKEKKIKVECEDCKKTSEVENIININCSYCRSKKIKMMDTEDIRIISVEA